MTVEQIKNINKIKSDLGENYRDDEDALKDIFEEVNSIALNISNNKNENQLFPYVKRAVKSIYITRGAEGMKSRNEGSISSSYEDIIDKLRNDIIKNGLRRIK